jgi:lysophospholipase L1-like esterase
MLAAKVAVPYNNLGIPGATTQEMNSTTSSEDSQPPGNFFFDFILRNPNFGGTTVLEQAIGRGPTLVTIWIGHTDILGGMLSGQPVVGVNITAPSIFATHLGNLLDELTERIMTRTGFRPTIAVGNIPGDVPYFLPVSTFETLLGRSIPFQETEVARVLFRALSFVTEQNPPSLTATFTLSETEMQLYNDTVGEYNQVIADLATVRSLAVVDIHQMVADLFTNGVSGFDAEHFLVDPSNTAFSLDGLHFNNYGYGLVANSFLAVINELTGTDLPLIDPASLQWDPTYGRTPKVQGKKAVPVSPEATAAMEALFR